MQFMLHRKHTASPWRGLAQNSRKLVNVQSVKGLSALLVSNVAGLKI
jgi:hypothetical protein